MKKINAIYLVLLGASLMSFVGLCIRLVHEADGFQILFYRSFSLTFVIVLVACLKRQLSPKQFFKSLDYNDFSMGVFLSLAFLTYVFAIINTSVASALFLLSISPIIAAIIAWFWIREIPHKLSWLSMLGAVIGVSIMINNGLELGNSLGNSFALMSAICFAICLVIARKSKKEDVLGGTFLGGCLSCLTGLFLALVLGNGFEINFHDLSIILFMGAFTIGLGITFVTWATPFIPAAEVSLLVLIESVLSPIWVWVFLKEEMTNSEIIGGIIVLLSVIFLIIINKTKLKNTFKK